MKMRPGLCAFLIFLVFSYFVAAVGLPLVVLFVRFFSLDTSISSVLFNGSVLAVLNITLYQALISTAIAGLLGYSFGIWAGAVLSKEQSSLVNIFLTLPYGIPTIVVSTVAVSWLGRTGVINKMGLELDWIYSLKAVVLVHVFLNIPFVAMLVSRARSQVPEDLVSASRVLGAGLWQRLVNIYVPYTIWSLASALVQVFCLCCTSFVIVLVLGGGPPVQTLETAIYSNMRLNWLDFSSALGCAIWLFVVTMCPWLLLILFKGRTKNLFSIAPVYRRRFSFSGFAIAALVLVFAVPYLTLFNIESLRSFADLAFWERIRSPLFLSLSIAFFSSLIAIFIGLFGAVVEVYGKKFYSVGFFLSLPSGLSVLVLALGVWLAYGSIIDPFDGSVSAMILLLSAVLVPMVFRSVLPLVSGVRSSNFDMARTLGCSWVRAFFCCEWPRLRAPLLGLFSLSFAVAVGEISAISLFYSEKLLPLPMLVSRLMNQYRFNEANAVAMVLFSISLITIVIMNIFGERKYA